MNSNIVNYVELNKTKKRVNLLEEVPLQGPLSVHIEPTNVCNFKCTFCPESFDNYEIKAGGLFQLKPEDYKIIEDQLATVPRLKTLNFFMMGEPLVNKNLVKYIKSASERNLSDWYMVSSNGTLLTKEKYQALCESGLDFLRISIFGSNEEIHSKNTQSKIKLEKVKDNVANLQKFKKENNFSKPRTLVKMIDSGALAENKEFLENFTGLGDETLLEPLTNWNDPEEDNLSKRHTDNVLKSDHYKKRKKKICPYPFYSMVIHSDLKVSVCCVDWEKKTLIGDLRKESLLDIWNGKKLRDMQVKHIQGKKNDIEGCKNCTYHHTAIDNIDELKEDDFLSRCK